MHALQYLGIMTGLGTRGTWLQADMCESRSNGESHSKTKTGICHKTAAGWESITKSPLRTTGNAQPPSPVSGCDPGYLGIAECTFPLFSPWAWMGHSPSCPSSFLFFSVLLQLSRCCALLCCLLCFALFALSACQGWIPVCFLLPPLRFSFLCSACLLSCSLARFLPSLSFLLFPRCWLWLAVLVPSLFPFPPLVCVKPQTKPGILARIRLLLTNVWPSSLQISQTLLTFLSDEIETFEL